jgi:hypothetical protein
MSGYIGHLANMRIPHMHDAPGREIAYTAE